MADHYNNLGQYSRQLSGFVEDLSKKIHTAQFGTAFKSSVVFYPQKGGYLQEREPIHSEKQDFNVEFSENDDDILNHEQNLEGFDFKQL